MDGHEKGGTLMNELNGVQLLAILQAFDEFLELYPATASVLDKVIIKYTKISNALDVTIDLE